MRDWRDTQLAVVCIRLLTLGWTRWSIRYRQRSAAPLGLRRSRTPLTGLSVEIVLAPLRRGFFLRRAEPRTVGWWAYSRAGSRFVQPPRAPRVLCNRRCGLALVSGRAVFRRDRPGMARHDGTHSAPLPGGAFVQSPTGLRDTKAKGVLNYSGAPRMQLRQGAQFFDCKTQNLAWNSMRPTLEPITDKTAPSPGGMKWPVVIRKHYHPGVFSL